MSKVNMRVKNYLIQKPIHQFLKFLVRPALLISNTIKLSEWISVNTNKNNKAFINLSTRDKLYSHLLQSEQLTDEIVYLEFGVFQGGSIKWWSNNNVHPGSLFYGFDTFEGLPEKWGDYKQGAFYSNIPVIDDTRVHFIKGLFQDTLPGFLKTFERKKRLVINLDADLFSSTMYALTSIAPFLTKGDVVIFDEFNVPNDEFSAFEIFCRSYYINFKLLGATQNYFQVGLIVV